MINNKGCRGHSELSVERVWVENGVCWSLQVSDMLSQFDEEQRELFLIFLFLVHTRIFAEY